jgi:hypothetical protein
MIAVKIQDESMVRKMVLARDAEPAFLGRKLRGQAAACFS